MSTLAQVTANQANAQHSTGPRTEDGKAAASRNRFVHGLCGGLFKILPSESEDEFEKLEAAFTAEHRPQTITETLLVRTLTEAWWLRNRAQVFQDFCLSELGALDSQELPLYIRYQAHHDRVFHRTLNELLKMRAAREKSKSLEIVEIRKLELTSLHIHSARLRLKTQQAKLNKLESKPSAQAPTQPEIGFVPQKPSQPSPAGSPVATAA